MRTYFITYVTPMVSYKIVAKVKAFGILHAIFKFKSQHYHMRTKIIKIEKGNKYA